MSTQKLYTVDQAEKTLPLVSRITGDITKAFLRYEKLISARRALGSKLNPGSAAEERAFELEREINGCEQAIHRYQDELTVLGIEMKDYRLGLLDFRSNYKGHIVYLCWKQGEERIGFWHDLHTGFPGRQAITDENRNQFMDTPSDSDSPPERKSHGHTTKRT
jgi:hypothetical protein